jgi:hypothetical protein
MSPLATQRTQRGTQDFFCIFRVLAALRYDSGRLNAKAQRRKEYVWREQFAFMKRLANVLLAAFVALATYAGSAQIQQAWVAKYNNNGITNGNHQALKMALDSAGNIYVLGVSANGNTNTGYAVVKYGQNGSQLWAARYDSTNYPAASPTGFALDSSNAVIVTGSAVTLKYDAHGNPLWTVPDSGQAVALDMAQNIYVTGISGDFTTAKLSPLGSNLWTVTWTYDGHANMAQAIAIDSSNGVYVAGSETEVQPRQNSIILGLVKYDTNGNEVWATSSGGGPIDLPQIKGLLVDKIGFVYLELNFIAGAGDIGGYQTLEYSGNGTSEWYDYNPTGYGASTATALAIDNDGNSLVTGGNAKFYPNDCYGTYKIGTNGNYIWTNLFPSINSGNSIATSIAVDRANSVYVTGFSPSLSTNGNSDIVTLNYDRNGNQVWVQRYDGPGNGNDVGNAIAVDNSGNVYVAGYETETNGFTSMILIKYAPAPTIQKQFNGNFILEAYGSPGETFDIQASTNLQTWVDLGDIIAGTNGIAQFDDTNAPLFGSRFYYAAPK